MKKCHGFLSKNWFRLGLVAAFVTSFSLDLTAQTAPAIQWDKTIGGSGTDGLWSLMQTADGGYILGGVSDSGTSGDKSQASFGDLDYWIAKLDATGNKQWDKTFGGNDNDQLFSVKQTSNGGYILGGTSKSGLSGSKTQISKGNYDFWVILLDAAGNQIWNKSFGGANLDHLNWVEETAGGGFILGGLSESGVSSDKSQPSQGGFDYWIIKLDASGNKQWDKTYGGNYDDKLVAIQQTADGGYIVGGESNSDLTGNKSEVSRGSYDYWVLKLDASGNKLWDKTYGGGNLDYFSGLQQTSDGGYILGGHSDSYIGGDKSQAPQGDSDFWIVKLSSLGNKIWDKTIGGLKYETLQDLQQTTDGGYILGGTSDSDISGDKSENNIGLFFTFDYWLVKLDSNGNRVWDKTLGGESVDDFGALTQTSDGGYMAAGASMSGIFGNKTQASKGGFDFWIVKLGPEVLGIKDAENNAAISIFPNPNQGKFTLQLNNLTSPKAEVTISDLLGRTILQQEFKTTSNQLSEEINLPNANGIYLLQLKAGDQITSRKIVVE